MPALNTAVAGLRQHQQKIDAIADNIANTNTVGFKGSRTSFVESFYQTLRSSSSSQPLGIQLGSGGQVSTIATVHSQGSIQRTGGVTDVAVSGEGFYIVRDASLRTFFTRAGDFTLDRSGNLLTTLGMNVRGVVGNSSSPTGDATDPGSSAAASLSNIVIPSTFVSQSAAVAASGTVVVGSDLPDAGDTLTVDGVTFTFRAAAAVSTEITIGATAAATATNIATAVNAHPTTGPLVTAATSTNVVTVTADTAGAAGNTIALTTTASGSEIAVPSSGTLSGGADLGSLQTESVASFTIGLDGKLSLIGSAGTTRIIAFLMIAKFSNPAALNKQGNNLYQFSEAAGAFSGTTSFSETADTRKPGTNGFGQIQSGALELSNVDLADQFAEMIVTQRGFEANARVITTGDELLQTVVNLKR